MPRRARPRPRPVSAGACSCPPHDAPGGRGPRCIAPASGAGRSTVHLGCGLSWTANRSPGYGCAAVDEPAGALCRSARVRFRAGCPDGSRLASAGVCLVSPVSPPRCSQADAARAASPLYPARAAQPCALTLARPPRRSRPLWRGQRLARSPTRRRAESMGWIWGSPFTAAPCPSPALPSGAAVRRPARARPANSP